MVEYLDIDLLNVTLVLPVAIRPFLVYLAPIPVYFGGREVGSAVYAPDEGRPVFRISFYEPGEYQELAYRYPACETEPVDELSGDKWFALTRIEYAAVRIPPLPLPNSPG